MSKPFWQKQLAEEVYSRERKQRMEDEAQGRKELLREAQNKRKRRASRNALNALRGGMEILTGKSRGRR